MIPNRLCPGRGRGRGIIHRASTDCLDCTAESRGGRAAGFYCPADAELPKTSCEDESSFARPARNYRSRASSRRVIEFTLSRRSLGAVSANGVWNYHAPPIDRTGPASVSRSPFPIRSCPAFYPILNYRPHFISREAERTGMGMDDSKVERERKVAIPVAALIISEAIKALALAFSRRA